VSALLDMNPPAVSTDTVFEDDYDALQDLTGIEDGDERGTIDDGRIWTAWVDATSGNVVWLPPDWYARVDGYVTGGVDKYAYMLLADDEAAAVARGWVDGSTGSGSFTKTAGVAGRLDSGPTTWDIGRWRFNPTARPTSSIIVINLEAIEGANAHGNFYLNAPVQGSTQNARVNFTDSAGLGTTWFDTAVAKYGEGQIDMGSGALKTLLMLLDGSGARAKSEIIMTGSAESVFCERASHLSGGYDLLINAYKGSGATRHKGDVGYIHWLEIT